MRWPPGFFARDAAADATDNRVLEGMLLKIDAERKSFLGIAMLPNMHAQDGETGILPALGAKKDGPKAQTHCWHIHLALCSNPRQERHELPERFRLGRGKFCDDNLRCVK